MDAAHELLQEDVEHSIGIRSCTILATKREASADARVCVGTCWTGSSFQRHASR